MTIKTDPVLAAGARIAAGDTGHAYGGVAQTLHWATVVLVLIQFGLSLLWEHVARPTRHLMIGAHMSFGILLGLVVIARIAWKLMPAHRVDPLVSGWQETASRAVHWLLYGLLLAQFGLGFYLRWSGGESMSFFGLQIPPMVAEISKAANDQVGEIHEKVGWTIILAALGHAGAALYHHLVLKDDVLLRMLPGRHRRRPLPPRL